MTFDKGEEVIWKGEPHKYSIVPAIIIGIILIPVAGLGLLIMAIAYIVLKNTDYVVTNRGVYKKEGHYHEKSRASVSRRYRTSRLGKEFSETTSVTVRSR